MTEHENGIPCKARWWIYRDKTIFIDGITTQRVTFRVRDIVKGPFSFEEKDNSSILKDDVSPRTGVSIFTSIAHQSYSNDQMKQGESSWQQN